MYVILHHNEHAFPGEGFEVIGPFQFEFKAIFALCQLRDQYNEGREPDDLFEITGDTSMYHQDEEAKIRTEVYAWVQQVREPT